jgi:vacuolar-type H+-ATPase subunit E/Vma4
VNTTEEPQTPQGAIATAALDETSAAGASDLGSGASLDKVRDILFGVQVREFERRFARLEERLVSETNELKEQITRRMDALDQRTASLNEQISTSQRESRQHQLDVQQRLTDDIRKLVEHALESLTRDLQLLRIDKADRAAVASIFTEMAHRLTAAGNGTAAEGPGAA